ncbi:MAG: ABC transporter ATP-binding protein [Nitrospirota bacterium]|nr:ABC transporter ATP-binding protein [Nitrospirota bacterium]
MNNEKILIGEGIEAGYFKKLVLQGVSFEIYKGGIVGLIGPNGAGKSTLIKVIFGLLKPSKGKIIFQGKDITGRATVKNVKDGISYFVQGGEVFSNLSILENLTLTNFLNKDRGYNNNPLSEVFSLFPELERFKDKRAGLLSGGERKMLALGILLVRRPKLLLLDEPLGGLASSLMKRFIEKIKEINEDLGVSILLVDQNIPQVLSLSKRVYLMKQGKIVLSDTPDNVLKKSVLEEAYFK